MPGRVTEPRVWSDPAALNFAPAGLATLAACTLFAAPALAVTGPEEQRKTETGEEQAEAETELEAKKDKRICRRIRVDMSSRRKTRVCLTAEEWRELNQRR